MPVFSEYVDQFVNCSCVVFSIISFFAEATSKFTVSRNIPKLINCRRNQSLWSPCISYLPRPSQPLVVQTFQWSVKLTNGSVNKILHMNDWSWRGKNNGSSCYGHLDTKDWVVGDVHRFFIWTKTFLHFLHGESCIFSKCTFNNLNWEDTTTDYALQKLPPPFLCMCVSIQSLWADTLL